MINYTHRKDSLVRRYYVVERVALAAAFILFLLGFNGVVESIHPLISLFIGPSALSGISINAHTNYNLRIRRLSKVN